MPEPTTILLSDPEHSSFAFSMPADATFQQWQHQGSEFVTAGRMLNWLIGDWIIAGVERFGERARDHANQIFRRDVDRLAPIVDTCRAFDPPKRRKNLSFTHHQIAAKAPDPSQALDQAERDGLSCADLRAHVRVAAPTFHLEDDDPEDAAYRIVIQASNRCGSAEARQMAVEAIIAANYGIVDL
jgi:hypothetical protein